MTEEQKLRVEEILRKGANSTLEERDELATILQNEPPVQVPFES